MADTLVTIKIDMILSSDTELSVAVQQALAEDLAERCLDEARSTADRPDQIGIDGSHSSAAVESDKPNAEKWIAARGAGEVRFRDQ